MDCTEAKNYFWDHLEKKLRDKTAFQEHLEECPKCHRDYSLFISVFDMVEEEKITSPNPFFVEKVINKVYAPQTVSVGLEERILSWLGILKPAFVAAGIVASIALGIYLGLPSDLQSPHPLDGFAETYGLQLDNIEILLDN